MSNETLPILPTSVIGSYAYPGWLLTALEKIDQGEYGETDIREVYDDACRMAILDQERAGIDMVSDGEMRRWYFVQSFPKRMTGLAVEPPLRKTGLYGYDTPTRYRAIEKVTLPSGLGIVDEFKFTKANTNKPIKVTCPGPLTMTIHIRPGTAYKNQLELCWQLAEVINAELKALVSEGAQFIQLDEPSYAVVPGEVDEWVRLYNACIEGVEAKHALHICFGNLMSRPRGKRTYGWMFPALNDVKADQLVLEFANREMSESDIWKQFDGEKELGAGVVDIKSFYLETAEDVAERIREVLQYVPADKLHLNPDCGFFQLPRWISYLKLKALVEGARVVRGELGG